MSKKTKELYDGCVNIVMDKLDYTSNGENDGVFVFFDKPFYSKINHEEKLLGKMSDEECILGIFFSYTRKRPADYIIVERSVCMLAERMPKNSNELIELIHEELIKQQKHDRINPVPVKWISKGIAVIPNGTISTRFTNCPLGRIASVAIQMSHCRVYH